MLEFVFACYDVLVQADGPDEDWIDDAQVASEWDQVVQTTLKSNQLAESRIAWDRIGVGRTR